METRAPFVLVGAFVLAAIVAVFGFVYWLNNTGGLGPRATYHIQFEGSVPGLLVGAAVLFFRRGTRVARLYSIAVAADRRGSGLGMALLAVAEQAARRRGSTCMRLEVRTDNLAARHLYERFGYRDFGVRRRYYEDGCDARRYQKALS